MSNGSKHKMYDYEVTPPPHVWDKIASALDETAQPAQYPSRLYGMEVPPPPGLWEKIAATIDSEKGDSIPAHRKIPVFIRYAAAAAIIAFLAWGGFRLLNNNSAGDKPGIVEKKQPVSPTNIPFNPPDQPTNVKPDEIASGDPANEDEARNDVALEESKKTYAKLNTPKRSKIKNAADFRFSLENIEPPIDLDPATRYIVLMTPDGNIIRMSKKLSDLVCCVSGEEQDANCVDQLKKWREKVAGSSLAYSPGNFGDILNLVKALQE